MSEHSKRFLFHGAHAKAAPAGMHVAASKPRDVGPGRTPAPPALSENSDVAPSNVQDDAVLRVGVLAPNSGNERSAALVNALLNAEDVSGGLDRIAWTPVWDGQDTDCLLLCGRGLECDELLLKAAERHVEDGRAIVVLGADGMVFPAWPDFDRDVLGVRFVPSKRQTGGRMLARVVGSRQAHPIARGVQSFWTPTPSGVAEAVDGAIVPLVMGAVGHRADPVAWTRQHNGGRVFHMSLATTHEPTCEMTLRILRNALLWALRIA